LQNVVAAAGGDEFVEVEEAAAQDA